MNLTRLYASGQVQRWHQNPTMAATGQTLADHQGRCVQLLLFLNRAPSPSLIRAVAFHDVGEFVAGDLSYDFKKAEPEIAGQHAAFEDRARAAICGADPDLTPDEHRWLKLVDRLECAAYVLLTRPWEAERAGSGWPAAIAELGPMADDLGCGLDVRHLIHELRMGNW